jgi:hypothetical protein
MRVASPSIVTTVAIAALSSACGGGASDPDAGVDPDRPPILEIVAPGDSVGVAPGASAELRVRYLTADRAPIEAAAIAFSLVSTGSTGGATLSAATAPTDLGGEAAVTFHAGTDDVDLRVFADAPGAQTVFYVSVSANGFATLDVTPSYAGARPVAELDRVELRLFRGDAAACDDLDPDEPPDSPLAPRTLPGWDETATWPSVAAREPYTLLVWGVHAVSQRAVSVACVELPDTAVPPTRARVALAVDDRPLEPADQRLVTRLDLAPLDAALAQRGAHRAWRILACPLGRGALILDWVIDALANDGVLDGSTTQPTGVAGQIAARRGAPGGDGCRDAGLDATIDDAIDAGGFPDGGTLAPRRAELLGELTLTSALVWTATTQARHRLIAAAAAGARTVILADTDRPVLDAPVVTAVTRPGPVALGDHGFTLRTGTLLRDGFDATALAPAGLAGRAGDLGVALAGSARAGAATGCAAIDQLACAAAGAPAGCAAAACAVAAYALDGALAAWWRLADGVGLDLRWSGTAFVDDADGDLGLDPIDAGAWTATLILADGGEVAVAGELRAQPPD